MYNQRGGASRQYRGTRDRPKDTRVWGLLSRLRESLNDEILLCCEIKREIMDDLGIEPRFNKHSRFVNKRLVKLAHKGLRLRRRYCRASMRTRIPVDDYRLMARITLHCTACARGVWENCWFERFMDTDSGQQAYAGRDPFGDRQTHSQQGQGGFGNGFVDAEYTDFTNNTRE